MSARGGRAAVIINPVSGAGRRRDHARVRAAQAAAVAERTGVDAEIVVTGRAGHARDLARAAAARGVDLVVAWGGDGTVNEVAAALAFGPVRLAIVPGGSGNGLARELGVPLDAASALPVAFAGDERAIDAGELDGRLFFNVAGVGLDADVAHRFARDGGGGRGLRRYAAAGCAALATYTPQDLVVRTGDGSRRVRALLVAIANSRQYGSGARIAPSARLDDGRLDLVVVEARPLWRAVWALPRLFTGGIASVPGVTALPATEFALESGAPMRYHVDGEPFVGGARLEGRVHAGAIRVRVPGSPQ